jgi:hypothetical protein
MQPGVNTGYAGFPNTWGPEVQFALDFRAAFPNEVLRIVKEADGGTPLAQDNAQYASDWSPDSNGELFDATRDMINAASATIGGLRPSAVFFGQGEEDAAHSAEAQAYINNLPAFFTAVRQEWMGDANGKIGIFEITTTPPYAAAVRSAQLQTDQADPNVLSIDTQGFPMQADSLHYAAAGHVRIGAGYFDMYETWRGGGSPPPGDGGQVITSAGPGSTLTGGAGADTLNASQGSDVLTGGAGADRFVWNKEPWSPADVTDFSVGTDKLDLSALFQAAGYTGSDPVADRYVSFLDDGAGGTKVLFDRDATAPGQQWSNYIIHLEHVAASGLTWAQLSGGSAPPPSPSPQLGFSSASLTLAEGNTGLTAFSYTVLRTGSTTGTSSASWTVSGSGGAPAGASDFQNGALPSGTVTFAAGETSKTILINVTGDTTVESNEGFTVTLSGSSGATLGAATAAGVITNDDASGQVINSPGPGSTLTGGAGADTLNASQGPDVLTGAGGADHFVYGQPPWNAGHVTDFTPGTDVLDLRPLMTSYSGSNPIADRWIEFRPDGAGGTQVMVDIDGPSGSQWPFLITTLDKVAPSSLGSGDWLFH